MTLLASLLLIWNVHAEELVKTTKIVSHAPPAISAASAELGNCRPQVDAVSKKEEDAARKAAQSQDLSKEELLARLIYSESLSTGYWKGKCQAASGEQVMESIGWGVMKRVDGKKKTKLDPYSEVIFAPQQFRTSFSGKKENKFAKAFLCPLRSDDYLQDATPVVRAADLYKQAQETAQKIINSYEKNLLPAKYKKVTNFFYPRSEFFGEMRPSWAKDPEPTRNKGYINILGVSRNPCVEFYQL